MLFFQPKYCTYLTIYSGDLLPPFYIGHSTISKIQNGYHGSVSSKKYTKIWKQELIDNPQLFKTTILEKFYSRKNAIFNERLLQIQFNVVKSEQFINMAIASKNFNQDNFGEFHWNYGKKNPKLSEMMKGNRNHQYGKVGELSPNFGKKRSNETKELLSDIRIKYVSSKNYKHPKGMKGKNHNEDWKKEHSDKMKGKGNPMYGKTRPDLSKRMSGSNHPNALQVTFDGIIYGCKKDACKALGISRQKLNKLLKIN